MNYLENEKLFQEKNVRNSWPQIGAEKADETPRKRKTISGERGVSGKKEIKGKLSKLVIVSLSPFLLLHRSPHFPHPLHFF